VVCRGRAGRIALALSRIVRHAAVVLFAQLAVYAVPQASLAEGAAGHSGSTPESKHLGVATCASSLCHGSARPLTARSVTQDEYVIWARFDPHARAYRVLREDAGSKIARRLGLKNAYEAPECLACHTDSTPTANRGERFQVSDGIGCEACHGGSEPWLATHDDAPNVTHADNLAHGLRAIERPQVRAQLCVSCHVGDSSRFATHQMMAAGHPRLAFELDTYTELWRTSGGHEHFRRDADYLARKGQFEPVQTWLAGLTATTRREADLVEERLAVANGGFPDFALFNCYSCHRSMRVAAWEKPDAGTTPPGTLRLHDGHPRALLAVLDATEPSLAEPLRNAINAMQSANGNPVLIHAANETLRAALARIEQKAAGRPWQRQDLEAALDALVSSAKKGTFVDYAAAEQAAMGMVLLLAELDADGPQAREVEDMFHTLQDDAQFDGERFARALGLLQTAKRPPL